MYCGMCLRNFAFKHFSSTCLQHPWISCYLNGCGISCYLSGCGIFSILGNTKGKMAARFFLLLIRWKMKSSPLLEVICVLIFLIILVIQHLKIWDPVNILSQKEQVHQPLKLNVYSSPCNSDACKKCGSNLINVITLNSLTFSVSWLLSHLHVLSNDFLIGCCWALLCFKLFYVCK